MNFVFNTFPLFPLKKLELNYSQFILDADVSTLERIVSEHLTEALGRDDCLKILSNFLPQLCGHLQLIYTTLMSNQSFQLSDPLKDFLLSLARISSIHDLRTVLSLQTGLESAWLETCQFNDQFVSALNRATTGSEEGNWEFLLLALQNREKTAVCLVEEASNNPGQVRRFGLSIAQSLNRYNFDMDSIKEKQMLRGVKASVNDISMDAQSTYKVIAAICT